MINNIKDIIRNRDEAFNASVKPQAAILNKLDQEMIHNYKTKLAAFENENQKILEETNSIKRNFEALCLKNKEDSNLIKKLEAEIMFLKNKIKSLELNLSSSRLSEDDEMIKGYKDKIESLNLIIKNLEGKVANNSTNSAKLQEKENFYRNFVAKLEEKNKLLAANHDIIEKEFQKLKVVNKGLKEENSNLLVKINNLGGKENEVTNLIKENQFLEVKWKNEKELIEKLLVESRQKIKQLDTLLNEKINDIKNFELAITNLNSQISNMKSTSEDYNNHKFEALKLEIIDKCKIIEDLKTELELIKSEKEKSIKSIEKLENHINIINKSYIEVSNHLKEKYTKIEELENQIKRQNETILVKDEKLKELKELEEKIKHLLRSNESSDNFNKLELESTISQIQSLFNEGKFDFLKKETYENYLKEIEAKMSNEFTKIENLSLLIDKASSKLSKAKEENKATICALQTKLTSCEEVNKNLKYESDATKFRILDNEKRLSLLKESLEKKINNKRNKIFSLRSNVDKLNEEVQKLRSRDEKVESIDSAVNTVGEENTKAVEVSSLCEKMKLGIETLVLILCCRSCSESEGKLFTLKCGHSLCRSCISSTSQCFECHSNLQEVAENKKINDVIIRVDFIKQVTSELNGLINLLYKI